MTEIRGESPNDSYNDALIRVTRRVCNNQTENKKSAEHDCPDLPLSLNNVSLTKLLQSCGHMQLGVARD